MSTSSPAPSPPNRQENPSTVLPLDLRVTLDKLRKEASTPAHAYENAVEAEKLREPADDLGYRLYAVNERGVLGTCMLDREREHVIVGRHTSCDFVLSGTDQSVSLRHALVRARVLDDGLSLLSVL